LAYHYDRLARNAWRQIEASEDYPSLKHYCYALRPALVLEWINRFHGTPPMDIYSICKDLKLQDRLAALIAKLVSTKALVTESDTISRITALDEFILSVLKDKVERPNIHPDNDLTIKADQLFRELIKK
jgi:predicted nucleotidyltransferase